MRPPTACTACRNRRRKCEIVAPGKACTWCSSRRMKCSFVSDNQNSTESRNAELPRTVDSTAISTSRIGSNAGLIALPPNEVCQELVHLYLKYIHDMSHSLFHPNSLIEDVASGVVPKPIVYGIIGVSARFSDNPFFAGTDPRLRGSPYTRASERLLDLRNISLATIQACVLIGSGVTSEGDGASETVYYAVACRNAMLLNLPDMPVLTDLEREINNRVWWSLFMTDVWLSGAMGHPQILRHRDEVSLPMAEAVFFKMNRITSRRPYLTPIHDSSLSLFAQMIKLNAIFSDINSLNQSVMTKPSQLYGRDGETAVDGLTGRLEEWNRKLPTQLADNQANLTYYGKLGLGGAFTAVYLGYYHYGQLLYYKYLHEACFDVENKKDDGGPLSQSHARYYADKCKAYSTGLCEILYRAFSTPGCEVYYAMVGHVLVIASTIQLHILLFSKSTAEIDAARNRLERNFEILTKLQTFWPSLDVCFQRLQQFHLACQKSKELSFRMDRWMLRFLYEFAAPVGEKTDEEYYPSTTAAAEELPPWSMENLGFFDEFVPEASLSELELDLYGVDLNMDGVNTVHSV